MAESLQVLLSELERFGEANDNATAERSRRMLNITRDTGELLSVLVQATSARRVLEIGTSNGYSTLWLGDAVEATGGRVLTVEIDPARTAQARDNLERAGLQDVVECRTQGAAQVLSDSGIPPLRRLSVEESDTTLTIRGSVPSYYMKQLAQETVMPVLAGRRLLNLVVVVRE